MNEMIVTVPLYEPPDPHNGEPGYSYTKVYRFQFENVSDVYKFLALAEERCADGGQLTAKEPEPMPTPQELAQHAQALHRMKNAF